MAFHVIVEWVAHGLEDMGIAVLSSLIAGAPVAFGAMRAIHFIFGL